MATCKVEGFDKNKNFEDQYGWINKETGEITINGAAARKVNIGDILILITYASMKLEDAKSFKPSIIFPNEENNLLS